MILEMIHDLPHHSRLVARRSLEVDAGEKEDQPYSEEMERSLQYAEARRWGNPQQELLALQVNALWRLMETVPMWEKGKGPKLPTIGPREWWPEEQVKETNKRLGREAERKTGKPVTVDEVMASLGFTGGA